MRRSRILCLLIVIVMALLVCVPASALNPSTLTVGSKGEKVRQLQQALIDLGFLSGKADGIFGKLTEAAVVKFQKANNLVADGLAGTKTQSVLFAAQNIGTSQPQQTQSQSSVPEYAPAVSSSSSETSSASSASAASSSNVSSSGNLFSGNYASLRIGATGERVRIMQQALIQLKYLSGKADGKFGQQTLKAVLAFQKQQKLSQDGVAGKKTLTALEKAVKNGSVNTSSDSSPAAAADSSSSSSSTVAKITAPDQGSIRLLHWYNDVKPALKNGDHLLIYDPSTGLSWTLRVMSRGRHCDSEPLTKADTETMIQAFGGVNTWNQKGVYVKLPSGIWTIGSTHDIPHLSGSIKDNGFNGHLCVHFLRNMDECSSADPNYGVSNQNTIRELWKKISGETISY